MYVVIIYIKRIIYLYFVVLVLHLPQEIVPATLKKSARPAAPRRACKFQPFSMYN